MGINENATCQVRHGPEEAHQLEAGHSNSDSHLAEVWLISLLLAQNLDNNRALAECTVSTTAIGA